MHEKSDRGKTDIQSEIQHYRASDELGHLSDREYVRARPAMYIGSIILSGLHQLAEEIICNAVEEFTAGYAKCIHVTIHADGSLTVQDDGRGIPVSVDKELSRELGHETTTLEGVVTNLHYQIQSQNFQYKTWGGLHGVGLAIVSFLSQWLSAEIHRDGKIYRQTYERGLAKTPVTADEPTSTTGTTITFLPDPDVFKVTDFDYDKLSYRLQELAYLNCGLTISLTDDRHQESETFLYPNGVADLVQALNKNQSTVHSKIVRTTGKQDGIEFDIAFQFVEPTRGEQLYSFANWIRTFEEGTHVVGFRNSITRLLNDFGRKQGLLSDIVPSRDDYLSALTAVVSVRVPHPVWYGATKTRLTNEDVEGIVRMASRTAVTSLLEENPDAPVTIIKTAVTTAATRKAKSRPRTRS